jgi:hypothetical protein
MLLGIDWFVVEDSSRKAKLVVSLYVVGFCIMYNIIHDVHKNKLKKFRKSFRPMK